MNGSKRMKEQARLRRLTTLEDNNNEEYAIMKDQSSMRRVTTHPNYIAARCSAICLDYVREL